MPTSLPLLAWLLGVAGLIPFVVCGIVAVSPGSWHALALQALIAYGAVILAFLGGVHWGFALSPGQTVRVRLRLALGVVPSLIGWVAVVVAPLVGSELPLALLIAGLIGTIATERSWARLGLVPSGYMALRWGLSIVVMVTLTTVLGLRLIGATIVF